MGPQTKKKGTEKPAFKSNRVAAAFSHVRQKQKQSENPFDKFSNAKKKHEVVNRRVKGEDRNVGRARAKAVDERKDKLLKDLQASRKSNSFVDKRFGEGDASMSVEEKMFLRFQKEKVKKAKNMSLYNLDADDNTAVLTHKGSVLGSANMAEDGDWSGSDDEDDQRLGREVVDNLHFGGGFVAKSAPGEHDHHQSNHNKSKAEVLQEIVMKSKLHKMERREAKDAQEEQRADIDKQFDALVASAEVHVNPVGKYNRNKDNESAGAAKDEFADYDTLYGAMQYDSKAQPSDRTKSTEELAAEAREKLEKLEAARLKRMNLGGADEDGVDLSLVPKNKKRRANDDEIDEFGDNYGWNNKDDKENDDEDSEGEMDGEDSDGEMDDDEDSEGEMDDDEDSEGEMDGEDSDGEMYDDEDSGGEMDDDEDSEGDDDDEDSAEEEEFDKKLQELLRLKAQQEGIDPAAASSTAITATSKKSTPKVAEAPLDKKKLEKSKKGKALVSDAASPDDVNTEMPHSIDCPAEITEFEELVQKYVRNPSVDFTALVQRIIIWNSIHLPGHQGTENKPRMHNFMDILVKYFIQVGNGLKKEEPSQFSMKELDMLGVSIFKLSQDLPDAATSLFGRTLSIMQSQLEKRLRDYVQGTLKGTCWPSLGHLLLLQLMGSVYATTDFRNSIVTAMSMFLCQCLTQCPIASLQDASHAILACAILMGYTAEVKRLVPEVITVVASLLTVYGPASANILPKWTKIVHSEPLTKWVVESNRRGVTLLSSTDLGSQWADLRWEYFSDVVGATAGSKDSAFHSIVELYPHASLAVFHALAVLVRDCHRRYSGISCYSELMAPVRNAMDSVVSTVFPQELKVSFDQLKQSIIDTSVSSSSGRQPLMWRGKVTKAIESLAPRYEVNYSMKKDLDPDHARVQVKQLQRQVKREQKAAMRELRRDSDFLGQEVYKVQQAALQKKRSERNANYAWMEQEQGVVNEQVRKGGEMLRGGGSGPTKPLKRVKRGKQ